MSRQQESVFASPALEALFRDAPRPGPFEATAVVRELGDGLVLRRAGPADVEAVAAFNRAVHADPPAYRPEEHAAAWTRELMDGSHPTMRPEDFLVVEDTKSARIASCLCLISHRVCYGEVGLACGQPELVGTHPAYRRRGLVAAQFAEIHRWSESRGQDLQLIDGIPWYYRQFGYEMALEQKAGRSLDAVQLASAHPDGGMRVRPATVEDAPFFADVQARGNRRYRLRCDRSEAFWRFELRGRGALSMRKREYKVVESEQGVRLAALVHYPILRAGMLPVNLCEVDAGVSWPSLLPVLYAELHRVGEGFAQRDGGSFAGAQLYLGAQHPLYRVVGLRVGKPLPSYAWYVRVPDLAGFLRKLAPALEAHLAASEAAGYSGRVELNLYRSGLRLLLEGGRIEGVESWRPSTDRRGHVGFPDLSFLQLLFGARSLHELVDFLPDCVVWDATVASVVEGLFPAQASDLMLTD